MPNLTSKEKTLLNMGGMVKEGIEILNTEIDICQFGLLKLNNAWLAKKNSVLKYQMAISIKFIPMLWIWTRQEEKSQVLAEVDFFFCSFHRISSFLIAE